MTTTIGLNWDDPVEMIQSGSKQEVYPRISHFANVPGFHNYATVRRQAKDLAEKMVSVRERVAEDGRFSERGQREQMAVAAGAVLRTIGKLRANVTESGRRNIEARRQQLVEKATDYDPRDVRREMKDAEIRAAVRAMEHKAIGFMARDATTEVKQAVIAVPAFVSGLPEAAHRKVYDSFLQDRVGSELEELEEWHELNETVSAAFDVAEAATLANAGVTTRDVEAVDDEPSTEDVAAVVDQKQLELTATA